MTRRGYRPAGACRGRSSTSPPIRRDGAPGASFRGRVIRGEDDGSGLSTSAGRAPEGTIGRRGSSVLGKRAGLGDPDHWGSLTRGAPEAGALPAWQRGRARGRMAVREPRHPTPEGPADMTRRPAPWLGLLLIMGTTTTRRSPTTPTPCRGPAISWRPTRRGSAPWRRRPRWRGGTPTSPARTRTSRAKEEAQNRLDAALADRRRVRRAQGAQGRHASTTRSSPARSRCST